MDIEGPQQWCEPSIEKLAPWVWLMQGVILVWYVSEGHKLPEAREVEALMGPWDSPTSLRHMLQVLRRATLNISIDANSPDCKDLQQSIAALKNLINAAAGAIEALPPQLQPRQPVAASGRPGSPLEVHLPISIFLPAKGQVWECL